MKTGSEMTGCQLLLSVPRLSKEIKNSKIQPLREISCKRHAEIQEQLSLNETKRACA